ncbi:DNA damage-binding protein 1a [Dispira parvispora]|uniref:DNA damage-binding protein 1 n=1 Tax=Dispira parvispora TaxID=1520584 RepID=A0A9W8AW13_9FUNG|nr:DNA damage-binding protein 1a [Dispira parvispora]
MQLLRPQGRDTDLLFVATEKYKMCVLSWDPQTNRVVTEANGDVSEVVGRPCDNGQLGLVDPQYRAVALHLYQGSIKIIPVETPHSLKSAFTNSTWRSLTGGAEHPYSPHLAVTSSKGKQPARTPQPGDLREAFTVRIEELNVVSMTFLHNTKVPTLLVLYRDIDHICHVKTYEVALHSQELTTGPWPTYRVENGANLLVPLSSGAAIIVGEASITYYHGANDVKIISMKPCSMEVYGKFDQDDSRILLGDDEGNLYILILLRSPGSDVVSSLKLQRMGVTSIASALVHLEHGYVYVGSHYGDSQLIELTSQAVTPGNYLKVINRYANLAPITDFCVVDVDKQGQGQVVACCGGFKEGTLRVIRNGIGIREQGTLNIPHLKRVWSLRSNFQTSEELLLVLGFANGTRLLTLNGTEFCEPDSLPGFALDGPTLHVSNAVGDGLIQVTSSSVRLLRLPRAGQLAQWQPPEPLQIRTATSNASQVLLGLDSGWVVSLEITNGQLVEKCRRQFTNEVSALSVAATPSAADEVLPVCAVSFWSGPAVHTLRFPELTDVMTERLDGNIVPRSMALVNFESIHYLLVALGDGRLYYFQCNPRSGELKDRRKVTLGTQPVLLTPFYSKHSLHVFAACDKPTVVSSSGRKLHFSNVNGPSVRDMCSFSSEGLPRCVALVHDQGLRVGTVDDIEKLHIRTIPLVNCMAHRICFQESTRVFGILTLLVPPTGGVGGNAPPSGSTDQPSVEAGSSSTKVLDTKGDSATSSLNVLDEHTFDLVDSFMLQAYEQAESLLTACLGTDKTEYFIVGTAFVYPNTTDTTKGRILILRFSAEQRKLDLVQALEVNGAVYSLAVTQSHLAAAINNRTVVYAWQEKETSPELVQISAYQSHVMALYLTTRGNRIAVGDLMRSIMVLEFNPKEGTLKELGRDYHTNWMTAIECLDDTGDHYIGAEISYNLFTVRRPALPAAANSTGISRGSTVTADDPRLETDGQFHLGEFVNRFRHGSLVMNLSYSHPVAKPQLLFGTVNGAIGVVASLEADQYELLCQVQLNLSNIVPAVGNLSHTEWRAFANAHRTVTAQGFIDGDLIEQFLDLNADDMLAVVNGAQGGTKLNISVDELIRLVEDLRNLY